LATFAQQPEQQANLHQDANVHPALARTNGVVDSIPDSFLGPTIL